MPAYEYIALDAKGKEEKGILEADNVRQVRQLLRDGHLTPLEVNQVEKSENKNHTNKQRAGRVKLKCGEQYLQRQKLIRNNRRKHCLTLG